MSDDYTVGYGKPPEYSKFKKGNTAAKGRRTAKAKALSIPEILDTALRKKHKIKRGSQVLELPVAEILVERLIHMMVTGSARDMAVILAFMERHAPTALAAAAEDFKVSYHRADGSKVPLPSPDMLAGRTKL